jgi:diguanylate cyclase (GGDEF)-like protein
MHVDESGTCLCEGLCPVTQTLADKTTRQADVFLHHREGHRVPVRIQVSPILDRNGNIVGAVEVFRETAPDSMAAQHIEDLKKAVLVDPMTGLLNRRFLDMKIQSCFEELHRHGFPFAVMGDEVLKMVSRTLKENIRLSDTAGRWGGEEFLLIFQHLDGSELAQIAEKLRVLVETSFLTAKKSNVWVTISMGATMARKGETADSLLGRADQLMYRAKSEGRNRVFIN